MTAPSEGAPAGIERRRAERVRVPETGAPVSVVGARLVDVSPYGMMIESPVAIEPDAVLPFRIVVDGRRTDVRCRVAMCRPGGAGNPRRFGVGLEFLDLAPEAAAHLRGALQRQKR